VVQSQRGAGSARDNRGSRKSAVIEKPDSGEGDDGEPEVNKDGEGRGNEVSSENFLGSASVSPLTISLLQCSITHAVALAVDKAEMRSKRKNLKTSTTQSKIWRKSKNRKSLMKKVVAVAEKG
jgi:hypothetical protein